MIYLYQVTVEYQYAKMCIILLYKKSYEYK